MRSKIDWTKWEDSIGILPDRELASQIGCSSAAVAKKRRTRYGPRWKKSCNINWSKYDHLIGTISDKEIATIANINYDSVKARRLRLGKSPTERRGWSIQDRELLESGKQICFGCNVAKPLSEFYSDKSGHRRYCQLCCGRATSIRKKNIKMLWISELGNGCQYCSFNPPCW